MKDKESIKPKKIINKKKKVKKEIQNNLNKKKQQNKNNYKKIINNIDYKSTSVYKKFLEYINIKKKNKNIFSLPYIEKIIVHSTSGKVLKNKNFLEEMFKHIFIITLQKPCLLSAKRSESKFRLMKGNLLGVKVTLRKSLMFIFLEKLTTLSLFRIKNFSGFKHVKFNLGSFSFGINDIVIFPSIDVSDVKYKFGLDINIIIKNSNNKESLDFLKFLGLPIL